MLRKLIADHSPQYIAASFDLAGPTFRSEMATDYKANRKPMPDELAGQIPLVHRACEALGVPIITYDRYEADDVIGTMTARAAAEGYGVAIVTGDKDFYQLVDDTVRVFNPREEGTWRRGRGKEPLFVGPTGVDVLALMGRTIDTGGVPGSAKGCARGIRHQRHTDALLERSLRSRKRVSRGADGPSRGVPEHRALLRMHTDVPVGFDISAFRYPDRPVTLYELFAELGSAPSVMVRATRGNATGLRLLTRPEDRGAGGELRAARLFGLRVLPDVHRGAGRIVGWHFHLPPLGA